MKMKKVSTFVITLLALVLTTVMLSVTAFAEDGTMDGDGSEQSPYVIKNYQDLKKFASIVNETHADVQQNNSVWAVLDNNIIAKNSASDAEYAQDWTPIRNYKGVFDGKGHKIIGISTPENYSSDNVGLFGSVTSEGTVTNVGVVDGNICGRNSVGGVVGYNNGNVTNCYNASKISGRDNTGGVVGYCASSLTACYNTGEVTGNESVGGVAGSFVGYESVVQYCYNAGKVVGLGKQNAGGVAGCISEGAILMNCYNAGEVRGNYFLGGIAGLLSSGSIDKCYNAGSVSYLDSGDTGDVGGLVGYSSSTITNCYNVGAVTANSISGGLVGWNSDSIKNCYNGGRFTGAIDTGGLVGNNGGSVEYSYFDKSQANVTETIGHQAPYGTSTHAEGLSTEQMIGMGALADDRIQFNYPEGEADPWLVKENLFGTGFYPHLKGFDFAINGQRVEFPTGVTEEAAQIAAADIDTEYWPAKITFDSITLSSPVYASKILLPELTVVKDGQTVEDPSAFFDVMPLMTTIDVGVYDVTLKDKLTGLTKKVKFTILPRPLTIKVNDQEYEYTGYDQGEADPVYDDPAVIAKKVTVDGLQGSDYLDMIVLNGTESQIGEYPDRIEITGYNIINPRDTETSLKDNYDITLVSGKLTIVPNSDPVKGNTPLTKVTAKGSTSLTIAWTKVDKADGYEVFFARCNHGGKMIKTKSVKTIKGNKTFKWTKSGLKAGTVYKALIKAYVKENGKKKYIGSSPLMHAFTGNGTKKYTNAKSVTVNKAKVTLAKGKAFKVKAKVNKLKKSKKLMPKSHVATVRYMSTDKKIATVTKGGKIKAVGQGACYVYVYAHNGANKKIKVTVK